MSAKSMIPRDRVLAVSRTHFQSTIGWLPDLGAWASNIARSLKPGGCFVFVEFHPALWMFDNAFTFVQYSYFNRETILEEEEGTYADREAPIKLPSYGWNHSLGEVIGVEALAAFRRRLRRTCRRIA